MEWRPIESAPRDGTRILVGRFVKKCPHGKNGKQFVDYWHMAGREGNSYSGFAHFNATYWPATHWMPLPSPPDTV